MSLSVRVMRAFPSGRFDLEYEGQQEGANRVQMRLIAERLQDDFDRDGEPMRVYVVKSGIPIEAAYCLRGARD
jgi:hypothetical protein